MVTDPRTFLIHGTTYSPVARFVPLPTLPVFRRTPSDFRFSSRNSRQSGNCTRQFFPKTLFFFFDTP